MFYFLTKFYTSNLGKWNISFLNLSRLFLLFIGVGAINEGLQILLLGIIFQRLHYKNAEFGTKNQVLLFLVVSNRKFWKPLFYIKRWWKIRYYEIQSKVKYRFGISMWLSKQNYRRISRNISQTKHCWHHKVQISAKQKMVSCLITIFCFLRKKLYKTFYWMDQLLFYL